MTILRKTEDLVYVLTEIDDPYKPPYRPPPDWNEGFEWLGGWNPFGSEAWFNGQFQTTPNSAIGGASGRDRDLIVLVMHTGPHVFRGEDGIDYLYW